MRWGSLGGIISAVVALGALYLLNPRGALHWIGFDVWKLAGNFFSNFYEEFIYRGFLLVALTALFGFWPAAVASSALFGFSHAQYPMPLQVLVSLLGFFWCWILRKAKTLWAQYTSHMVLDIVVDAVFT
ncbi:MAG: CPBP family intramembrane metalloprotease [Candidatus Eremiobacteraeota bacterium]|nr:CPBP family intramembrane metalloprotease [Candidatus Eremiobacteraeota bacterium]